MVLTTIQKCRAASIGVWYSHSNDNTVESMLNYYNGNPHNWECSVYTETSPWYASTGQWHHGAFTLRKHHTDPIVTTMSRNVYFAIYMPLIFDEEWFPSDRRRKMVHVVDAFRALINISAAWQDIDMKIVPFSNNCWIGRNGLSPKQYMLNRTW